MFGYIRPHKPELKIKEYEIYKSIYCSLCKQMGKSFGIVSRLFLSYDCTFLSMIYLAMLPECPEFKKGKCVVNPLKGCNYCLTESETFIFASAVSIIMSYYKVIDDIKDSNLWGRLKSYVMLPMVYFPYKKSLDMYPQINEIVSKGMDMQFDLEGQEGLPIDAYSEPTAYMLSEIMSLMPADDNQKRVLKHLGYFIGRWVYLIDAADDMDKDIKKGEFNPLLNMELDYDNYDKRKKKLMMYCNEALNQNVCQIITSYELLDIKRYGTIIDNIINLGLAEQQKQILFKKEV